MNLFPSTTFLLIRLVLYMVLSDVNKRLSLVERGHGATYHSTGADVFDQPGAVDKAMPLLALGWL